MSLHEVDQKVKALEKSISLEKINDLLDYLKKEKIRRSDLVVKYGKKAIDSYIWIMGDDAWNVYEQTFIAALDTNDMKVATECLMKLKTKFPHSHRVQRLEGMEMESKGYYEPAKKIYEAMLGENSANALVLKRMICIHKAQGNRKEAIFALNEFLKKFQNDISAWQELSSLYLEEGEFRQAAFCYEEMILSDPLNSHFHGRLAEIHSTLGKMDDIRIATKHFLKSIELNPKNNLRSYVGLLMCTKLFQQQKRLNPEDRQLNNRLFQKAKSRILEMYQEKSNSSLADNMKKVLDGIDENIFKEENP